MRNLPDLRGLHSRHFGLTPALAVAYAEAAGICMSRHHTSPAILAIHQNGGIEEWTIAWPPPSQRELQAWANDTDRTEAGACSVALAAIEACMGLVAISRAETLTGADYYVGGPKDDFETAFRLEVSGVDRGDLTDLRRRVARKRKQVLAGSPIATRGGSPGPSTGILFFNTERTPLDDTNVRRAIASALPATQLLPPALRGGLSFTEPERRSSMRVDLSRSLELLVPWAPRPYMREPLAVASEIQQRLAAVGVSVDVVQTDGPDVFVGRLERGEFDLALGGWIADTSSAVDFYEALHDSNHSRWTSPEMDAALVRFREVPTSANARAIELLVAEQAALVPLLYGRHELPVRDPAIVCVVGFEAATIIITVFAK